MTSSDRDDQRQEPARAAATIGCRFGAVGLVIIVVTFLALRGPVMYHQPGGYDEDFYAVPGLSILQNGIPQLPHVPARNSESVFFRADRVLYSEPPLYFYVQALFYTILPHVYGTARLTTAIAGLAIVAGVYRLSIAAGAGAVAAIAAAALFSWSRWFYFPAICARPDTLCAAFGVLAIVMLIRWLRDQRVTSLLLLTGVCLGLGGLTHFFAIIYAIQIGLVVLCLSRGRARLINPVVLTATAIAVFCAWLPLIAIAPDIFKVQLGNQLGDTSGGPIWQRVLMPMASLQYQLQVMWEHIGAIQVLIPGVAMLLSTCHAIRSRNPALTLICGLGWSSIYLICVFVGPDHPVIGYWIYPAGLMFVALASALHETARRLLLMTSPPSGDDLAHRRTFATVCGALAVVIGMLFVPGCGLRTLYVHVRNWNDINYDAPRFAQRLMEDLPADEVCAVDAQFVVDFVAAGRPTLLATDYPPYFRVDQAHFDRLIVSRHAIDKGLAQRLDAVRVNTAGIEDDKFACYAEIYDPPDSGRE